MYLILTAANEEIIIFASGVELDISFLGKETELDQGNTASDYFEIVIGIFDSLGCGYSYLYT